MAHLENTPGARDHARQRANKTPEEWYLERETLSKKVIESVKVAPRMVREEEPLKAYLNSVLKTDRLVLRALGSLRLQGYQSPVLPQGYTVEVSQGRLFLYKTDSGGSREYYKSPQTGKSIDGLPLLEANVRSDTLYFKSGGYQEGLPDMHVSTNSAEARQMAHQALKEGQFAKLTGMVNGVPIRDRVRLQQHHAQAAQEILFLLEHRPSVFDAQTLEWIRKENLDALHLVSNEEWAQMNTPGTKAFKQARSARGVIQLILAWKRLRSVLPDQLVKEIHEKSLDTTRLETIQMRLTQTESDKGESRAKDRRVVVESVHPRASESNETEPAVENASQAVEDPLSEIQEALEREKVVVEEKEEPQPPEPEVQGVEKAEDAKPETVEPDQDIKIDEEEPAEPQSEAIQAEPEKTSDSEEKDPKPETSNSEIDKPDQPISETSTEKGEIKKTPEQITQDIWEEAQFMFKFLVEEHGIETSFSKEGDSNGRVVLRYTSGIEEDGKPIEIHQAVSVELPSTWNEQPKYKKGDQSFVNPGEVVLDMVQTIKKRLKEPAAVELGQILQTEVASLRGIFIGREKRQEKRKAKKGDFNEILERIRKHYDGRKALEMQLLLGGKTEISTGYGEGGISSIKPWTFNVVKSDNDEIGLEIGGGKMKHKHFYSLQSDADYEIED